MSFEWPVPNFCDKQLRDINPDDIRGDFRLCDTEKAQMYEPLMKEAQGFGSTQFIVQLWGCPFDCWYCYVTRDGVFGATHMYTSEKIVEAFHKTDAHIFHLMGGAPGLYLNDWGSIIRLLGRGYLFHSDLLLVEGDYTLTQFTYPRALCKIVLSVSLKGWDKETYKEVTGVPIDLYSHRVRHNFDMLVQSGIPFYITMTGFTEAEWMDNIPYYMRGKANLYHIPIIGYKALA